MSRTLSFVHDLTLLLATTTIVAGSGCGSLIVTQMSADSLRSQSGFDWETHEIPGCTVYAEPGSISSGAMPRIAETTIEARRDIVTTLEVPRDPTPFSVFVVDDRERMRALIGRRTNATGFHTSRALCVAWPLSGTSGLRHETVHIVTMNAWGVPERWVNEGLAVDLTGPWIGRDVDAVCKLLRERGKLPTLDELTRRFNRLPSPISYPAAGSFVRYVRNTHGLNVVRLVWQDGRRGLPLATGQSMEEIEAAWLAHVDGADAEGVTYDPLAVTPPDDRPPSDA